MSIFRRGNKSGSDDPVDARDEARDEARDDAQGDATEESTALTAGDPTGVARSEGPYDSADVPVGGMCRTTRMSQCSFEANARTGVRSPRPSPPSR